ncbi:MAG: hypothetical protein FWH37_05920 [Candidatus Bathyarchaeota archaeon]|nr:hypothetical protein [Candidatus Termiticorpusculum sp.]
MSLIEVSKDITHKLCPIVTQLTRITIPIETASFGGIELTPMDSIPQNHSNFEDSYQTLKENKST